MLESFIVFWFDIFKMKGKERTELRYFKYLGRDNLYINQSTCFFCDVAQYKVWKYEQGIEYDYPGMLQNIITRRALILQKCNVPQRNDNSGGSTGIAMSDATGWSAAETAAAKQQSILDGCKMQEVKAVLTAIKKHSKLPADSPLRQLKYSDIKPNTNRQKNYELTTKVNFFATAVSHGINGLHALKAMNAFEDVNQVWEDSKELIEKYQQYRQR